jgi:hypothetical protein
MAQYLQTIGAQLDRPPPPTLMFPPTFPTGAGSTRVSLPYHVYCIHFNSLISNFTYNMFVFFFVQNQSAASNEVPPQSGSWDAYANEQPTPQSGWGNRNGDFGW